MQGLLLLDAIALGGIIYLLIDSRDVSTVQALLMVFSSVLSGLLGLFAPSPIAKAGGQ